MKLSGLILIFLNILQVSFGSIQKYQVGINYFKDKRFTRASLVLEQFVKTNPDHPLKTKAEFFRGEALRRSKSFVEATQSFENVILSEAASESVKTQALYALAESYKELGDIQKAERHLTQILVLYPETNMGIQVSKRYPKLKSKLYRKSREFSRLNLGEETL